MRISDWSSDVCSSDLPERREVIALPGFDAEPRRITEAVHQIADQLQFLLATDQMLGVAKLLLVEIGAAQHRAHRQAVRDGEFRHQAHAGDVALEAPLRHGGPPRRHVLDYRIYVRPCHFASSPESHSIGWGQRW